jgi:nucleoside-diphosphate-sugar epimerase
MTEVLIVGAGYVGDALTRTLMQRGDRVYALRRTPVSASYGESVLQGNVCVPESISRLPVTIRQIVYLVSPDEGTDTAYKAAYVDGLTNLLASPLVQRGKVERIVFASSTSVYAQTDGSWVDESSRTAPTRFSGQRLLEAESILQNTCLPTTSLRFAGIYGPGRQRLLSQALSGSATLKQPTVYRLSRQEKQLERRFREHTEAEQAKNAASQEVGGTAGAVGNLVGALDRASAFTNRIHRDDCAGFVAHLLASSKCDSVYIGVDSEPVELKAVLDFIADTIGSPRPRVHNGPAPRSRGGNKRCSNQRLLSTGYQLKFPTFREGYSDLILQAQHAAQQQQ